jgi:hypothetical protein
VPVKEFPANWGTGSKYNVRAAFLRNEQMAEYGEALIAVWDQRSNGTRHTIKIANARKLRVLVVPVQGEILFKTDDQPTA